MPDIFLSYSREDQAKARRFAEAFERAGLSVWWDQALNPGEAFDHVTERALDEARAVVVLWSKASVGSRWVRAEATQANSSGKLVPVMIEPCKRPIMFELTHSADLSGWKGDDADHAWQSFVASVGKFVGHAAPRTLPVQAVTSTRSTRLPMILVLLGVVVLLGVGGWWLTHPQAGKADRAVAANGSPAATAETRRLLVLPFTNIAEDKGQDYFARGLTEELLTQLQQIRALTVLGSETSFAYQDKAVDPVEIRTKLNVQYLLGGTVRKDGNRVRITPRLTDTSDGRQLWIRNYEGDLKDVWSLQEQIAAEVARELSITLDVSDLPRAEGGTTNVEAYDRFLMALDRWSRGDLDEAIRLLRESTKLDPDFVRAKVTLAIFLAPSASQVGGAAAAAMMRERMQIMAELNARNLSGPLGLQIRSMHSWWARDWKTAMDSGLLATERLPYTRSTAFMLLVSVGRLNEAIPIGLAFEASNPLEGRFSQFPDMALELTGRRNELEARLDRHRQQGYQDAGIYMALFRLLYSGSTRNPQDLAELKAAFADPRHSAELSQLHSKPEVALEEIQGVRQKLARALEDPANQDEGNLLEIATLAHFYGDDDLAFKALRKDLIEMKYPWPFAVWQYPGLRSDPRFKDLVRDMGLVDYWRSSGKWSDFCEPVGNNDFTCH